MGLQENLARLRRELHLSQEDLAEQLGVSRQTISRWEVGTATPTADNLLALGMLYGVSAEELMDGDMEDILKTRAARGAGEQTSTYNAINFKRRRREMQLSSLDLSMSRPWLKPIGAPAKTSSKEDFSSHFSGPDDVTVGRDMYGTIYYQSASPYMRLMDQYERYLAQRTEQYDLPASTGLTEENISYLKERFSGELTWMEREDALSVMVQLGIINNVQKFTAHQDGFFSHVKSTFTFEEREAEFKRQREHMNPENPLERDWNVLLKGTPISKFNTIDDILRWVDQLPEIQPDPLNCRIDSGGYFKTW